MVYGQQYVWANDICVRPQVGQTDHPTVVRQLCNDNGYQNAQYGAATYARNTAMPNAKISQT